MSNVVSKRKKVVLGAALALLILGLICSATLSALERGPFVCNNGCLVQAPLIDANTAQFLDSVLAPVDRLPMAMYVTGTTYIICNATHCATYRQTFSGEYVGSDRVAIEGGGGGSTPPSGGGGGTSYWGVVGYEAVYREAQTCTPSGCSTQMVLVGYQACYGWIQGPGRPTTKER